MARTVDVVPYDENWIKMYQIEKVLLESIFDNIVLDIQHIGSTSVPHLSAKPIIDILVIVSDINEVDNYNSIMKNNAYIVRGENGAVGRRYFVKLKNDNSGNHTHHVHIYQKGNIDIINTILFRDYLRVSNEALLEYENIKKNLAYKFRFSPIDYTNGKNECVDKLLEKAKIHFSK